MRKTVPDIIEKARVQNSLCFPGELTGMFIVKSPGGDYLQVIASDGSEWFLGGTVWEHVSVRPREIDRCCTWDEMCFVKSLFWDDTECVIQFHPAKSDYVNVNQYVLHLWKPVGIELSLPPRICV